MQGENGQTNPHKSIVGVLGSLVWVNFSRGRKSKLLFKSGKRLAEALMTSVGFGVTRPRTCCIRKTTTLQYKHFNTILLVFLL